MASTEVSQRNIPVALASDHIILLPLAAVDADSKISWLSL